MGALANLARRILEEGRVRLLRGLGNSNYIICNTGTATTIHSHLLTAPNCIALAVLYFSCRVPLPSCAVHATSSDARQRDHCGAEKDSR